MSTNAFTPSFMRAVQTAIDFGGELGPIDIVEGFNKASAHVAQLVTDAALMHGSNSYGTSAFLSITAIEETAKAELLRYRTRALNPSDEKRKVRDPLRDHSLKHRAAVRSTTFMGRLPQILGLETCQRLEREAHEGVLLRERERALYVHAGAEGIHAPLEMISHARSRELLLLAAECAGDVLVGYTKASLEHGKVFERVIAGVV